MARTRQNRRKTYKKRTSKKRTSKKRTLKKRTSKKRMTGGKHGKRASLASREIIDRNNREFEKIRRMAF